MRVILLIYNLVIILLLNACNITNLYTMGTATMDTHRTLQKKRQAYLIRNGPTSHSISQLSNVDRTLG